MARAAEERAQAEESKRLADERKEAKLKQRLADERAALQERNLRKAEESAEKVHRAAQQRHVFGIGQSDSPSFPHCGVRYIFSCWLSHAPLLSL